MNNENNNNFNTPLDNNAQPNNNTQVGMQPNINNNGEQPSGQINNMYQGPMNFGNENGSQVNNNYQGPMNFGGNSTNQVNNSYQGPMNFGNNNGQVNNTYQGPMNFNNNMGGNPPTNNGKFLNNFLAKKNNIIILAVVLIIIVVAVILLTNKGSYDLTCSDTETYSGVTASMKYYIKDQGNNKIKVKVELVYSKDSEELTEDELKSAKESIASDEKNKDVSASLKNGKIYINYVTTQDNYYDSIDELKEGFEDLGYTCKK